MSNILTSLVRFRWACFAGPGFGREETLLKVLTINALYGTNVYAQVRMADHVHDVMNRHSGKQLGPALVEEMAQLQPRKFWSFASKFAHFFLDANKFPIYDQYAVKTVRLHLGRRGYCSEAGVYTSFVQNLNVLVERSEIDCCRRALDKYLWLAGLYRSWQKNPSARINVEASSLFADEDPSVAEEIAMRLAS